jgi:hypothetical protein
MATVTLLAKARQRRLNALASLGSNPTSRYHSSMSSIFDTAFDADDEARPLVAPNNVIAFRSTRTADTAANDNVAASESAAA